MYIYASLIVVTLLSFRVESDNHDQQQRYLVSDQARLYFCVSECRYSFLSLYSDCRYFVVVAL